MGRRDTWSAGALALLAVFALVESARLDDLEREVPQEIYRARIGGLLPSRADWRAAAGPIGRGSVLGFVLGILPGIGAIIPTFISYALVATRSGDRGIGDETQPFWTPGDGRGRADGPG